jgi:hypothetical protein
LGLVYPEQLQKTEHTGGRVIDSRIVVEVKYVRPFRGNCFAGAGHLLGECHADGETCPARCIHGGSAQRFANLTFQHSMSSAQLASARNHPAAWHPRWLDG